MPQLADYMRSQGATRGLLIDGKTIMTFELSSGQIVSTGEIYLKELVEKWRGESLLSENKTGIDAFDKHDLVVLQAFWQRFNKSAFAGLKVLIDDLTLTDKGKPHTADGKTWRAESRIKIFEPHEAEFNSQLAEKSARMIEMIALDVEAQLALRLDEYKQYEAEMNAHPNGLYTFKEMFERHWLKIFSQTQAWGISETRRNSYSHQLRLSFESGYNGLILDNVKQEIEFDVKEQNNSLPEKKKRKDAELKRAVREINQIVDEISLLRQVYHKRRETLFRTQIFLKMPMLRTQYSLLLKQSLRNLI